MTAVEEMKKMNDDAAQSISSQIESTHAIESGFDHTDTAIIAEDTTVSGDLQGTGNILVKGTVTGRIRVDGAVTVAGSGTVRGPIEAGTVYVSGRVVGDITAKTSLRLEMAGSITGDATMRSFTISDGGYFSGQSHMTESGAEPVIIY